MQCNIDGRGRRVRLVVGVVTDMAGTGLLAWWLLGGAAWLIWPAVGCMVGGTFGIVEGALGWCAVRAMGFRTPI
jgi:hypothetical protein